jgi:CRISPR-associated protein Cas1
VPSASEARPLYVSEQGAYIGLSGGRIVVRKDGEKIATVRLIDVSQVNVYGRVQLSTQAMQRLFRDDVPIAFFTYGGWFTGIAHGHPSRHARLRARQVAVAAQGAVDIARKMVAGKIANSRTLLRRNARTDMSATVDGLRRDMTSCISVRDLPSLLGVEGSAARRYFGAFSSMLREDAGLPGEAFTFKGRNRRPPRDPVNAMLSFVYALLVKDLTAICLTVGLDPYIGIYHQPRFGRPAMALDLAEEFRPLIGDSTVVLAMNNGEITPRDFIVRAQGVEIMKRGRRALMSAYERRLDVQLTHPRFRYRASYRRLLETQTRLLAAVLLGELDEYEPLVTR